MSESTCIEHERRNCRTCKVRPAACFYIVRAVVVVDRPDRRDDSFIEVPAGHRFVNLWTYRTRREAVGVFNAIVRGEHDFGSEYTARVEVLAQDVYRDRSAQWVRRPVERKRRAGAGQCAYDCGHALCLEAAARDAAEGLTQRS